MQMEEGVCAILGGKSGDSGPIKAAPSSSPFQFSTERVYAGDRSTFPAKSTAIRASLVDQVGRCEWTLGNRLSPPCVNKCIVTMLNVIHVSFGQNFVFVSLLLASS